MELIIDFSWLWNRSLYAFKDLTSPEGEPTGAMYGLLKFHEAVACKGYKIIACLDDFSSERKELYEDYKSTREVDDFRLRAKKTNQALFEILNFLGWEFYKTDGLEADDIIASRAIELAKQNTTCIIYSSDKDLQQLMVFPTILISSSIDKGNFVFKSAKDVEEKIGVKPELVRYFRPLKGDSSDNIKSATPRIQTKYLIPLATLIEDNLMLGMTLGDAYTKAVEKLSGELTSKAKATLLEGKHTYCVNFQLMDLLKYYHTPAPQNKVVFREMTEEMMLNLLDRYGLKEFKGNYIDTKVVRGL